MSADGEPQLGREVVELPAFRDLGVIAEYPFEQGGTRAVHSYDEDRRQALGAASCTRLRARQAFQCIEQALRRRGVVPDQGALGPAACRQLLPRRLIVLPRAVQAVEQREAQEGLILRGFRNAGGKCAQRRQLGRIGKRRWQFAQGPVGLRHFRREQQATSQVRFRLGEATCVQVHLASVVKLPGVRDAGADRAIEQLRCHVLFAGHAQQGGKIGLGRRMPERTPKQSRRHVAQAPGQVEIEQALRQLHEFTRRAGPHSGRGLHRLARLAIVAGLQRLHHPAELLGQSAHPANQPSACNAARNGSSCDW